MDHNKHLLRLLQTAELKARMGLYYLNECNVDSIRDFQDEKSNTDDIEELYNSSQIYCKNLEKQLKEKNEQMKKIQLMSDEVSRHNEAMLEEINHLNNKLGMYPKTISDLKNEIGKLSIKVTKLEEQKKYMEQQAAQNETRLLQSNAIQQDLVQSQAYIVRLKKYLDNSSKSPQSSPVPVLVFEKETQTASSSFSNTQDQIVEGLKEQCQKIVQLRSDLVALRKDCYGFNSLNDDIDRLKELLLTRNTHVTSGIQENGIHDDMESVSSFLINNDPIPTHFLLNVERVEVLGRVLPPDSDLTLTTYTNNTNNTDVIVNDNNSVSTFTLDMVLPMNAPQQQLSWLVRRVCQRVKDKRSVMVVMMGEANLTMYGTPENHGLLRHLVKSLLLLRKSEDTLTLSIGTFVNNQMCDGLSEFSSEDGKVTAVNITELDQGIKLLSEADIPDEVDQVLHQFTYRNGEENNGSVSILECDTMDSESSELLNQYRACGKVPEGSRPNVLYDTVHAYAEKGGAVIVYLNLKPDLPSTASSQRLLRYSSQITGREPATQNKRRGLFSFRSG